MKRLHVLFLSHKHFDIFWFFCLYLKKKSKWIAIDNTVVSANSTDNGLERPAEAVVQLKKPVMQTDVIQKEENKPGKTDYYWSSTDEPHASRRKEILAKYPEIKKLYGPDPYFKYVVLGVVLLQCYVCFMSTHLSTWQYVLTAYIVGGTANHMLMLAMHELSHNLAFKQPVYNRWFGLLANLPLGVPSCATFRKYHMEHHRYQGTDGIDVDIPTSLEGRFFCTKARKLAFIMFQIFFYALRPGLIRPKAPGFWEYMNWIVQISFDIVVFYLGGKKRLAYFFLSSLLGTGLHPVAGHFISEHFVFVPGTETYSYYGFWNIFAFNVGYHNEHHDFPYIPGSRLPQVRAIAREYYDTIPQCESWIGVLWNFIMDDSITGFSRVKRHESSSNQVLSVEKKSV
jgi:sphingolipid delta-4 desaturase